MVSMNPVQQAVLEVAEIQTVINNQIEKLQKDLQGLIQTRDASQVNPEIILGLYDRLNQANAKVQTAVEATKKRQDEKRSSLCDKVTSCLYCSKNRCKTVRLLVLQGITIVTSNASSINSFLYPKEESDITTSSISLAAALVAGVVSLILFFDNKEKEDADLAAKHAMENLSKENIAKELRQKEFLLALADFKVRPDTPALQRCITTRKVLEEQQDSEGLAEIPKTSELAIGLIQTMSEENEYKRLVDQITTHAKQSLNGSPKQSYPSENEKPMLKQFCRRNVASIDIPEQEGKISIEVGSQRQCSDPVDPEPAQIADLEEYSKKWTALEKLMGVPLDDLVLKQGEEVSCNKQGQCWRPQTPKEKGSQEPHEKERFIHDQEHSSDPSLLHRIGRIGTPFNKGGSGTPPTPPSLRLSEAPLQRGSMLKRRPSTPLAITSQGDLQSGLPSNSEIQGLISPESDRNSFNM